MLRRRVRNENVEEVAILWRYNKAQLMYTSFIYYAKCIND